MHIFSTDDSYSSYVLDNVSDCYIQGISDELCPFIGYSFDGIEEYKICFIRCGFGDWLVLQDRSGISLYVEDIQKFIYKGVEYVNTNYSK